MGGKTSTSTSQTQIPQTVLDNYSNVNNIANQAAQTPFQQYSGQFVAPTNSTENSAISNISSEANEAQPYYQAATGQLQQAQAATQPYYGQATSDVGQAQAAGNGLANASLGELGSSVAQASPIGAQQINQYLSPYLTDVAGTESQLLSQENQQAQAGQLGSAITSGAFGGDRAGIAAANLNQQNQLSNANILSGILNTGYNTALSTAQQQQGVGISAAQTAASQLASLGQQQFTQGLGASNQEATLGQDIYNTGAATSAAEANLGAGAQSAALSGSQAQLAAGQVQQQTQQAQDTAEYNQFLQQQSYPFQTAQFLANIAEGTGALSGSTTTSTTPGGLFSDRRLKENIRKVGKLKDGQVIYAYNYKGDNVTHVGLMADEVEKKHPEAVGLSGGYKTVDYAKATEDSAERKRYASGGLAGYGDSNLGAITQAEQQMFANAGLGSAGMSASGVRGASSYVPQSNSATPVFHPAPAPPPTPNGLAQATQLANLGNAVTPGAKTAIGWAQGLGKGSNDNTTTDPVDDADALNSTPVADMPDPDVDMAWRGGRLGRAIGGATDDNPYDATGLDIPNDQPNAQLNAPAAPKPTNSTLSDLTSIAKIGTMIAGMNTGGSVPQPDSDDPETSLQSMLTRMFGDLDEGENDAQDNGQPPVAPPGPAGPTGLAPPVANANAPGKAMLIKGLGQGLGAVSSLIQTAEGTGKNPNSSAHGPYQFIDPTWLGMFKQTFPQKAAGMSDKQILAIRNTPQGDQISSQFGPELARQNIETLKSNGIQPSAPNVYLAHFLGPRDAMKVISADPSTPIEKLVPAMDISANRFLKGKTAGDAINWSAATLAKAQARQGRQGFADGGAPDTDVDSDPVDITPVDPADPKKDQAAGITAPDSSVAATAPTGLAAAGAIPDPMGLGSSAPPAPPSKSGGLGGMAHDALEGLKKPENFIPLLTGLAAFAAAPTQHPFVALAQGLGAAGQSYQGQRQFAQSQLQQNRDYSLAQTGLGQKQQQIGIEQQGMNIQGYLAGPHAAQMASSSLGPILSQFKQISELDPVTRQPVVTYVAPGGQKLSAAQYQSMLRGVYSSPTFSNTPAGSLMGGLAGPGGQNVGSSDATLPVGGVSGGPINPAGGATSGVQPGADGGSGLGAVAPTPRVGPVPVAPTAAQHKDRVVAPQNPIDAAAAAGAFKFKPNTPPVQIDHSQLDPNYDPASLSALSTQMQQMGQPGWEQVAARAKSISDGVEPSRTQDGQEYRGFQLNKTVADNNARTLADAPAKLTAYDQQASKFQQDSQGLRQALGEWDSIGRKFDTNRGSDKLSDLDGHMRSLGLEGLVPDAWKTYQGAVDRGDKLQAYLSAGQAINSAISAHAPASVLENTTHQTPGPTRDPSARRAYSVMAQARLNQMDKYYGDYLSHRNDIDLPANFDSYWFSHNPISNFQKDANVKVPPYAGMAPSDVSDWIKAATPSAVRLKSPADMQKVPPGGYFIAPDGRFGIKQ